MASSKRTPPLVAQQPKKRRFETVFDLGPSLGSTSLAMVHVPQPTPMLTDEAEQMAELLFRERSRIELDINPAYVSELELRREVGFSPMIANKTLAFTTYDLRVVEFRRCITAVLTGALKARYFDRSNLRQAEITAEINTIVPLTVSACMCALYSKLRSIHRTHGRLSARYAAAPHYNKDIELPLPLAVAIQEFGIFKTESMIQNRIMAPTYPEATQYEGRAQDNFNITDYQTYIPTFKDLGIPCKSVDPHIKSGSAWWTYKLNNAHGTTDLVCTIPPTNYSDLGVALRSLFLATAADSDECSEIIAWPEGTADFGTNLRENPPNSNIRAFLALCHGPLEEWSNGHA
ncbi:unknown [Rosa multiflora cryptic virus]|uniref:putative coat protein n=1 Tax=Rose cryptic virus 1 TaxID=492502 RepID=UPI0001652783|nr:putative coat protein [Rose cryptic virus 1]ABV89763.1 unknown [Rosa multiflora cryptic virus]ABZ10947.1 putative coat protein [Rose cryptic virus 1]AIY31433.1 hypothetical protein [Rose cryptic virus 1]QCQ67919.1 hypothetical protein [Rose cryptic virus 1]